MSWVDNIAGCPVRQNLQSLILNLTALHQPFCKPKNSANFTVIADVCDLLIEQIEADAPPSTELTANLINSLNTQIAEIVRKKEGRLNQQEFDKLLQDTSQKLAKMGTALQEGIRNFKPAADSQNELSIVVSATPQLRKALVDVQSRQTLLEFTDTLREIPQNSSFSSLVSRAFFKHRVATLGGLSSMLLASGNVMQSGMNAALHAFDIGIKSCSEPLNSVTDSRVVSPAILLVAGTLLFSYALCRSRSKPLAITTIHRHSMDEEEKVENTASHADSGKTPLLVSPRRLTSS
jgi:hypothetical protein